MQTYQDLTGPAKVVQARIAELEQRRLLLALTPPRPHADGWRVRVWYRVTGPQHPAGAQPVRRQTALPAPPQPWRPGWPWKPGKTAAWLGVAAVAAAVLWIIWQAVTTAVEWTTDHTGQLIAGLVPVALCGLVWLRWRLRKPGCPGHTHHCTGCRSH